MDIFDSNDNAATSADGTNDSTTIITHGAAFKGELSLKCDLFVDGELEGQIASLKSVIVGKHGVVKGEVQCKQLIVRGVVEGSVDALEIEVKAHGRLAGSVVCSELVVEDEGVFEGESTIITSVQM